MNWRAAPFWGYLLFVVYGSLVPLDFTPIPFDQALESFRHIPFLHLGLESRADWVANGVLYAPLGFLASRWINVSRSAVATLLAFMLACLLCTAVAVAVEFTQLFFPPRTVSQNDIIAETLGSVLGAFIAPFLGNWLARLRSVWAVDGARLVHYALQAYAVGYVLFCFFPFDLLLSVSEIQGKWASDLWSLGVARPEGRGWFRLILQWVVEVALCMPLGLLYARRGRQRGGVGLWQAAMFGAGVGLAIEVAQFFVASAVSQGASVISRALGVAGGVWLARRLAATGLEPMRRGLARTAPWLVAPYLLLLAGANGDFSHRWTGLSGVARVWSGTRLLPFYYHYYTTEALALYSLGAVVVMYLPLTFLAWARGLSPGAAATLAALLSMIVEGSKLFQAEAHPDPTNVLLASSSVWLGLRLVPYLQKRAVPARGRPTPAAATDVTDATNATDARGASSSARWPWALAALPAAGAALMLPAHGIAAALVVVAAAAATWWRPALLLVCVPAAMPVFDLAPWTGRFFIDEFDFLVVACLGVGLARVPPAPRPARPWDLTSLAFALFGISLALATLRGLWPLQSLDVNSLSSYYSPLNALRIAKGALWAWGFVALYRRLVDANARNADVFVFGMNLALALTVLVILWERAAFVDWFDFEAEYRVTGPFSAMHKGGAYIECFLAVAAAYTVVLLVRPRAHWITASALVLLTLTAYAEMVTYSRNGYAAFALVVTLGLITGLAGALRGPRRVAGVLAVGVVTALVAAVVLAVLSGSYARQRLSHVRYDLATRAAHWADALRLRDDGVATLLLGVGVGRFPESHFWRSQEPARAAGFRIEHEGDNRFLRLGAGAPIYLDQIVAGSAVETVTLSADLRATVSPVVVAATVCRKWMLTSTYCRKVELRATGEPGRWLHATVQVPAEDDSARRWRLLAPLKLTLLTPDATAVDIDNVVLRTPQGESLLANGDFQAGLDRWLFFTDIDPPWHIHNLPVALLFDQGWLGVVSALSMLGVALAGGLRGIRRGNVPALAALAGSAAFMVSGSLNTLIDSPRFLWLWLVLLWISARSGDGPGRPASPAASPAVGSPRPAT